MRVRLQRTFALGLLMLLAVMPAAEAAPMLGGRISPSPFVMERDEPKINVTNLSTLPVTATVLVDGDGWTLGLTSLELAVNERRSIPITAAGEDRAEVRVRLTPATAQPGVDTATLELVTTLRHHDFIQDDLPRLLPLLALLVALLALAAVYVARRRSRGNPR